MNSSTETRNPGGPCEPRSPLGGANFQHCSGCTIEQLRREWRKGVLYALLLQIAVGTILIQNFLDEQSKPPARWVQMESESKSARKKAASALPMKGKSHDSVRPLATPSSLPSSLPAASFYQPLDERLFEQSESQSESPGKIGRSRNTARVTQVLAVSPPGGENAAVMRWTRVDGARGPNPTVEGASR